LTDGRAGALDADLAVAVRRALTLRRDDARAHALRFSWQRCAEIFAAALVPTRPVLSPVPAAVLSHAA
jgi:hypothetical protein